MIKSKFKRVTSLFLATLMCVTTFAGIGSTTAYAASGEKADVYMVDFPRDGDANYDGVWGHSNLTLKNGWHTGRSNFTNLKAIGSYSGNEDYCKWCYADGTYTYNDMDDLIEVCVKNMVSENFTEEQARSYMKELLPTLDYWKKYDELSDNGQFEEFKKKLINEINELNVDGMPKVEKLNALVGKYVNLEYRLPNGQAAKFLNEAKTYLGNQLECEYGGDRCFGVVADIDFILICTYEEDGKNPELVLYKKR